MSYREDVRIIKALADENRLAILDLLQSGEKCACVLLEELRITQPTLSHHMRVLCDAELVDSCKDGKWIHYSLSLTGSNKLQAILDKYTISKAKYVGYKKCEGCLIK